jgi:hypothetical protein
VECLEVAPCFVLIEREKNPRSSHVAEYSIAHECAPVDESHVSNFLSIGLRSVRCAAMMYIIVSTLDDWHFSAEAYATSLASLLFLRMPLYIYKWKSFCDFLWNCRKAAKLRYELETLTKHDILLLMPEGAQYLGSLGFVSFRDTAIQSVLVLCIRDTKRGGSENQTS